MEIAGQYPPGVTGLWTMLPVIGLAISSYIQHGLNGRTGMKFDGFDDYRTDQDLEAGQGIDLKLDADRVITIHRAGGANRKYQRVTRRVIRPHQRKLQNGNLDPEISDKLMREIYAESVIVGWSGITSDGQDVPFNKTNCVAFLESFPEVFDAIQDEAQRIANFIVEQKEGDAETLGNV